MPALGTMSQEERRLYQDSTIDSDVKAAVGRRYLAIQQAYLRVAKMQGMSVAQREDHLREVALRSNRDYFALRRETEWAEGIQEAHLVAAFANRPDWLERIDIEHLIAAGQARDGFRVLTSIEKCALLVEAYEGAWGIDMFRQQLADRHLIPEPKGMPSKPSKAPMASTALKETAEWLERTGTDFPMPNLYLNPKKALSLFQALSLIRDRFYKLYPSLLIPSNMVQRWSGAAVEKPKETPERRG